MSKTCWDNQQPPLVSFCRGAETDSNPELTV